jgi:hypothetical protein
MRDLYRHGDLLFRPAAQQDVLRTDLKSRGSNIILEGEVTGHAHKILEGEAAILDFYEETWRSGEQRQTLTQTFLQCNTETVIAHEEHGPLAIPAGLWEVVRAREFDYAANLGRRVMD